MFCRVSLNHFAFCVALNLFLFSCPLPPGILFVACQAVSTLLSLTESLEILHLLPLEHIKNLVWYVAERWILLLYISELFN